jgi:hypothetical protein
MRPPFCPAALKNFAATYSALPSEEAVLSFALPLGRLILSTARPVAGMYHYWGKRGGRRRAKGRQRTKERWAREGQESEECRCWPPGRLKECRAGGHHGDIWRRDAHQGNRGFLQEFQSMRREARHRGTGPNIVSREGERVPVRESRW